MSERYIVNPVLVQAYSEKAIPAEADPLKHPSKNTALWWAIDERVTAQIRTGPNTERYFVPDQPSSVASLSERNQYDLDVGLELMQRMGGCATEYYLAETALSLPQHGDHFLLLTPSLSDSHRNALLRTEEGLCDEAANIQREISRRAINAYREDGKRYLNLPGWGKAVPVAGWWIREPSGSKRLLSDVPSCEVFMAATVLDQAQFGEEVVRVVPYSMEDREVSVHRMLAQIGQPVNAYSIVTAPSGDIKKIRHWGEARPPAPAINDLYATMRVDRLANQVATTVSQETKRRLVEENSHLSSDYAPNRQRSLEEAYDALCFEDYRSLMRYEQFRPSQHNVGDVFERLQVLADEDSSSALLYMHDKLGKNTNSIVDMMFSVANVVTTSGERATVTARAILTRALASDVEDLEKIFAHDNVPVQRVVDYLAQGGKTYYLLLEGHKNER